MASMRDELEQRRDGMWTGAYVSLLLVVPGLYGVVLAPGLLLKTLVVGALMVLTLVGYVLATCARGLEEVLEETATDATTTEAGADQADAA